jgi:hypothetical protein
MGVFVIIRWTLAAILCGVAALLLLANWGALFASLWYRWEGRDKHTSMVPLVGSVLGTAGLLICPAEVGWYALTYWLLEPMMILSPLALMYAAYRFVRKVFI